MKFIKFGAATLAALLAFSTSAYAANTYSTMYPPLGGPYKAQAVIVSQSGNSYFPQAGTSQLVLDADAPALLVQGWTFLNPISGAGSVTSIVFGSGLTGGTINSSGTVTVDPAQSVLYTIAQNASIALASNTSGDGLVLKDPTLATAANQQYSPRLHFTGNGWATTPVASQPVDWIIEAQPVQGAANPTSNLVVSSATNGGAFSTALTITSGGGAANNVTFTGGVIAPSSRVTGATVPVAGTYSAGANSLNFAANAGAAGSFDASKNFIHLFAVADQSKSVQVPTTAFSITIGNNTSTLILNPAGTLASGTIALPTTPIDGQDVRVTSTQIITSLTVTSSQTILNAPTTIGTAGSGFMYTYHLATTTWFRLY